MYYNHCLVCTTFIVLYVLHLLSCMYYIHCLVCTTFIVLSQSTVCPQPAGMYYIHCLVSVNSLPTASWYALHSLSCLNQQFAHSQLVCTTFIVLFQTTVCPQSAGMYYIHCLVSVNSFPTASWYVLHSLSCLRQQFAHIQLVCTIFIVLPQSTVCPQPAGMYYIHCLVSVNSLPTAS